MNYVYVTGILIIIGICSYLYWRYTRDTYIVRINKNQIMEFKTAIELTGLPIITFYQGKNVYNFLLDTGSNTSYINNTAGLEVIKSGVFDTFIGASGEDIPCEKAAIKLYRDEIEYECPVSIANLDTAFAELKNSYGVSISGILGNDFFIKYKYCLDFKELVAYRR